MGKEFLPPLGLTKQVTMCMRECSVCACLDDFLIGYALSHPHAAGHLPTFRLLESLSRRSHPTHQAVVSGLGINFGSHVAISQAIGFLFLGAGNSTFQTSNEAIAALLISVYPRLPTTTTDQRCHLQVTDCPTQQRVW